MVKRVIDITLSLVGLILLSPIFFIIGIMIKLDTKGPIFFTQKRVGKDCEYFQLVKFRTMVTEAESMQLNFTSISDVNNKVLFKIEKDPRVTRVGYILRKYSLDELPQLWNVLKGEMSIVGPRCLSYNDFIKVSSQYKDRWSVPQGITGLWQIQKERWRMSFEEIYKLDKMYIDNWSIYLDIYILIQTVKIVLRGKNC